MLLENCEGGKWSTFCKPLVAISADAVKHGEVENVTRKIAQNKYDFEKPPQPRDTPRTIGANPDTVFIFNNKLF
jgi:hypothetical protein